MACNGKSSSQKPDVLLAGCLSNFKCGVVKLPESGHSLSPWVKCTFRQGNGSTITVGNESSPTLENSAVIKSFDFGFSDGGQCKITIHDTAGSSIARFIENMLKEMREEDATVSNRMMIIQWGWTKSGCSTPPPSSISDCHYLTVRSMETNFVQGKFIHEITADDAIKVAIEGGIERVFGGDGQLAISLKEALRQLFTESPAPTIKSIRFCRVDHSGNVVDNVGFEFENEGPKGGWKGNSANKLQTALSWISGHRTENRKTFLPTYNTGKDGGEVIFWEQPVVGCQEKLTDELCFATYVVNGGKDSPVIEFNPKIQWDFSTVPVVGGQQPGETIEGTPQNKAQGVTECPKLSRPRATGSGQTLSVTTTQIHKDIHNKGAMEVAQKAQAAQSVAMGIRINSQPIEADMVIVGDPAMLTQADGVIDAKFVGIAFVNPFHLLPSTSSNCGDWIVKPPCNEILSSRAWLVRRINHRISEGTYTTTLGLRLDPGFELAAGLNG